MSSNRIVILDTNQQRREILKLKISEMGHIPFCFASENICLDNLVQIDADLIISSALEPIRNYKLINGVKLVARTLPMVILTRYKILSDFINCDGYNDIFVYNETLDNLDLDGIICRSQTTRCNCEKSSVHPILIGKSPAIKKIKEMLPELVRLKEVIFIQGEPGTGKELVARTIRSYSDMGERPFIRIDLATLCRMPVKDIVGLFSDPCGGSGRYGLDSLKSLDGGTLYFHEIGRMPYNLQSQLMVFIESGIFSDNTAANHGALDVRVIASTSDNFSRLLSKNRFRRDLYYRINAIRVDMPPLRKRLEDIPLLIEFFTYKFCNEYGKRFFELSADAKKKLCGYLWPGNIRELTSFVKKAVLDNSAENILNNLTHMEGKGLDYLDMIKDICMPSDPIAYVRDRKNISLKGICRDFVDKFEKEFIKKSLEVTRWNRKKTAILLDISYKTLLDKIRRYELN